MKVLKFKTESDGRQGRQLPHEMFTTVREGTKWSEASLGEEIGIEWGDSPVFLGIVRFVWKGMIKDIPTELLLMEHDYRCWNKAGLKIVLRECYGPDFSDTSFVTVLGIRPC